MQTSQRTEQRRRSVGIGWIGLVVGAAGFGAIIAPISLILVGSVVGLFHLAGTTVDQAQLDAGTALVTIGLVVEGLSAVVVWGVTIVVCARGAQFRIGIAASIMVLAAGVGVLSLGLTSLASMDAYR